jgi:hypothetical protein
MGVAADAGWPASGRLNSDASALRLAAEREALASQRAALEVSGDAQGRRFRGEV